MNREDVNDAMKLLRTAWPCTHYGVKRYHTCPLCEGHVDIDSDVVEKTSRHEQALDTVVKALEEALTLLFPQTKGDDA